MFIEKAWVKAKPNCYVWDDEAGLAGVRRYIGWEMEGVRPKKVIAEGVKVDPTWHIRRQLRKRCLIPMDAETAAWARVPMPEKTTKKPKDTGASNRSK